MTTTEEITTEVESIIKWRRDELVRAGYGEDLANKIAEEMHIDLHVACDLVRGGCPDTVAADILL